MPEPGALVRRVVPVTRDAHHDRRQIFAFSGILKSADDRLTNFDLTNHALSLLGKDHGQRVCYVPTAVGDSAAAIEFTTKEYAAKRPGIDLSVLRFFNQPSVPDIRKHLLAQDVILVEGGSVVNLMAVWRAHGLAQIMRECWEAGVVLAGASAAASAGTRAARPTRSATASIPSPTVWGFCRSATGFTTTSTTSRADRSIAT